ncbi:unnamed protein product [Clavelina lepadiformis]|uniref:Uncharacterized protein n=1 Tax=Clavelina lepadiformis TaxID=159417 RepID=A0ABP0GYM7_CLALP
MLDKGEHGNNVNNKEEKATYRMQRSAGKESAHVTTLDGNKACGERRIEEMASYALYKYEKMLKNLLLNKSSSNLASVFAQYTNAYATSPNSTQRNSSRLLNMFAEKSKSKYAFLALKTSFVPPLS